MMVSSSAFQCFYILSIIYRYFCVVYWFDLVINSLKCSCFIIFCPVLSCTTCFMCILPCWHCHTLQWLYCSQSLCDIVMYSASALFHFALFFPFNRCQWETLIPDWHPDTRTSSDSTPPCPGKSIHSLVPHPSLQNEKRWRARKGEDRKEERGEQVVICLSHAKLNNPL